MKLDLRGFQQHCVVYIAACSWTYQRWSTASRQLVNLEKIMCKRIQNNSRGPRYTPWSVALEIHVCLFLRSSCLLFRPPTPPSRPRRPVKKKRRLSNLGVLIPFYSLFHVVDHRFHGRVLLLKQPATCSLKHSQWWKPHLLSHRHLCGQLQRRCFQLQFFKSQVQPIHLAMSWVFALCWWVFAKAIIPMSCIHMSCTFVGMVHGIFPPWCLAQSRTCSK